MITPRVKTRSLKSEIEHFLDTPATGFTRLGVECEIFLKDVNRRSEILDEVIIPLLAA
jgi:hypothetical protein